MRPEFIELSGEINDFMKVHTVNLVEEELSNLNIKFRNSTIGILGLAYKKDINDIRESPALDIINDLFERGAKVKIYDPYIMEIKTNRGILRSEKTPEKLFKDSDAIIIVTDHTVFRKLKYDSLINKMRNKIIVDTRNMLQKYTNKDLIYVKI
jgi:UDP-N-acetyl-D-glucosamine dehydrogenase